MNKSNKRMQSILLDMLSVRFSSNQKLVTLLTFLSFPLAWTSASDLSDFGFYIEQNDIYLHYKVTSSIDMTVEISPQGTDYLYGDLIIPQSVTYYSKTYKVTSIGNEAFKGCSNLTSVVIPETVTSIGYEAFRDCPNLSSVIIPESVTSIGDSAFEATKLYDDEDNWDNGVLYIGKHLIKANPEQIESDYYIKDGTVTLSNNAFSQCYNLKWVTMPHTVKSIGRETFFGCRNLTSAEIPGSVTTIGDYAFTLCALPSVTIPGSVTTVGKEAFGGTGFYYDKLNWYKGGLYASGWLIAAMPDEECDEQWEFIIEKGTVGLANGVLYNCDILKSVTIPNSVTSISDYAFSRCRSLTSVTVPNSVISIGKGAFQECTNLTSVTIPYSVKSIGVGAFSSCNSLTSITIPNSVTSISDCTFLDCTNLTSITIPNSVTSIGEEAFNWCRGLTNVTIPNSVTSIGEKAFIGCRELTNVTLPNSVKSIGDGAFYECSSLSSVSIPDSTSIGVSAFSETALYNDQSNWVDGALYISNHLIKARSEEVSGEYTIRPGTLTIANNAFSWCKKLTSVTIPNTVTLIGDGAFNDCEGMSSVDIPESVASIGHMAFHSCGLTSVTIPNTVTFIGEEAFSWCRALTTATLSNSLTYIGREAFRSCSYLSSVTIPESVTYIGTRAFESCNLKSVTALNPNPASIYLGEYVFSPFRMHATLYVPSGCKNLYASAAQWWSFDVIKELESALFDITTDIDNNSATYDLMGRKVNNPSNSIYIKNGKKILIR